MKATLCLFCLVVLASTSLFAQEGAVKDSAQKDTVKPKYWQFKGVYGVNMTQTSLTNWVAGGQNAVSILGNVKNELLFNKNRVSWHTIFSTAYGLLRQEQNTDWWKTDDRIELSSKFGYQAVGRYFYTGEVLFRSQYSPGYKYPNDSTVISDWMSPGYLLASAGIDYKYKDNFSLLVSPATAKLTFVQNQELADAGNFGVKAAERDETGNIITPGQTFLAQFGGYLKVVGSFTVKEKYAFKTSLDLFSNYLKSPQNIDVNWETTLTTKISKVLSVNINTHLIYDDEVGFPTEDGRKQARVQFKQILGVGLSYLIDHKY